MEAFGKFVIALVLIIVGIIFQGWVLSLFWEWFVISMHSSIPTMSVENAIGLSFLTTFLTKDLTSKKNTTIAEAVLTSYIAITLLLFFGFIVHLFM